MCPVTKGSLLSPPPPGVRRDTALNTHPVQSNRRPIRFIEHVSHVDIKSLNPVLITQILITIKGRPPPRPPPAPPPAPPPTDGNMLVASGAGPGGGGGTASLRVGTQNKTTDPQFCATTALSHCPCCFTARCFLGIK